MRKYVCACCEKTFTSVWTEEEAIRESEQVWGRFVTPETHATVCDTCYGQLMRQMVEEPARSN